MLLALEEIWRLNDGGMLFNVWRAFGGDADARDCLGDDQKEALRVENRDRNERG